MKAERAAVETTLVGSAVLLFTMGASIGALVFLMGYDRLLEHLLSNDMPRPSRDAMLLTMFGTGAVLVLGPALYVAGRGQVALDRTWRAARILSPLTLVFALPLLFDYQWSQRNEWAFVLGAGLFGLALERSLRLSLSAVDWNASRAFLARLSRRYPRLITRAPPVIAAGLTAAVALYFAYYTVLNHYRLGTTSYDLGIFDNMMWNLIRGRWFFASPDLGRVGSHIQFHATFLAYLFAPFYALVQRAETLLVLQAVLAALAAAPIYLLAKLKLRDGWAALVLAYAYLMHAPMHGPVFYDFHFLTTAPFWVGWVLYFFETERKGWLLVSWLCALLLREDISAGLAAAALFFLASGRRPRWALWGGLLSIVYFACVKFWIMPLHRTWSEATSFTWMFQALVPPGENGMGGVLRTMLSNPVFTFNQLLEQDKLTYIVKMLGPVLILPLRHPKTWILFLPPAIFTLLSSGYKPLYQTFFQYTSNYSAYLFFASAVALAHFRDTDAKLGVRRFRMPAAVLSMLATATIYSYSHGAILKPQNFVGGFRQIQFSVNEADRQRHRDLYDLIAMIPKDASVAATELEVPHLSTREFCFTLRQAYEDAEYLLINVDEARQGTTRDVVREAIESDQYGFVTGRGNLVLWKRGHSQANNDAGRRALGIAKPPKPGKGAAQHRPKPPSKPLPPPPE